jgi:hypothetical protein
VSQECLFIHLLGGTAKAGKFKRRRIKLILYPTCSVRQFKARGSFDFERILAHLIENDPEGHAKDCGSDGYSEIGDDPLRALVHGKLPQGNAKAREGIKEAQVVEIVTRLIVTQPEISGHSQRESVKDHQTERYSGH